MTRSILIVLVLVFENVYSQKGHDFGITFSYLNYNHSLQATVVQQNAFGYPVDKYLVKSVNGMDGFRLGLFYCVPLGRTFAETGINYFQSTAFFSFLNLLPAEDAAYAGAVRISGQAAPLFRRIEWSGKLKVIQIKKIQLHGGIAVSYNFFDSTYDHPDEYFMQPAFPLLRQDEIYTRFARHFIPWVVWSDVSIQYPFGPLTLGLSVSNNLTSLGKTITFRNAESAVNQRAYTASIDLSYILNYKK